MAPAPGPERHEARTVSVNPSSGRPTRSAGMAEAPPTHRLPDAPLPPATAYQLVHDELMLDGNSRLNLAHLRHHLDGAAGPGC